METDKKIPIVVLNYNDYDTAAGFLDNFKKNLSDILELVFVDNNSTDGSFEKIQEKYGHLGTFLKNNKNEGYGRGNNLGLRYARDHFHPEYIIVSNPDIKVDRDTILILKKVISENENVKLVAPAMLDINGKETVSAWKLPGFCRETFSNLFFINHFFKLDKKLYSKDDLKKPLLPVDVIGGSFFMADAQVFERVGFFDEDTFLYCEENILGYRLKQLGYREMLVNTRSYVHMHNVTIGKTFKSRLKRYRLLAASKKIYLKKCLHIGIGRLVLYNVVTGIGILERKIGEIFLRIVK